MNDLYKYCISRKKICLRNVISEFTSNVIVNIFKFKKSFICSETFKVLLQFIVVLKLSYSKYLTSNNYCIKKSCIFYHNPFLNDFTTIIVVGAVWGGKKLVNKQFTELHISQLFIHLKSSVPCWPIFENKYIESKELVIMSLTLVAFRCMFVFLPRNLKISKPIGIVSIYYRKLFQNLSGYTFESTSNHG